MELIRQKSTRLWSDFPVEQIQTDSSTETMFIRRMVEYVASDIQNGTELTDSINKTIDDVILRDLSEKLLSEKANEFVYKTDEPPLWLINLCKSPIGKALFMYVLKDPVLHDTLMKNDYNGLVEFFISTVILNSSDLKEDLTNIDLTCCTLSTSLLLFERMINQFSNAHSYEECNELIHSFVSNYNFNSPEELIVFFNYILETEKASTNANFNSILNVFIERTFLKVCKKHSVTPMLLCILSGTSRFQSLYNGLQNFLNGDYSHVSTILDSIQQFPPTEVTAFFENRLYGLVLNYLFEQLITIQFTNSHFLEITVQFLYFLLTKDLTSPPEQKQLLSVLRLCTCRDATRFRNDQIRSFLLSVCKDADASLSWFYREYCMNWLSYCFEPSTFKNFTDDAISYFVDLLIQLGQQAAYKEHVLEVLLCTQDIYPSIDRKVKEFVSAQLKEGYLGVVIRVLHANCSKLNQLTVMSYVCMVFKLLAMPYPAPIINAILSILLQIVGVFKGAVDNTVKGFFLEFVEACQEVKGEIDGELYTKVVKECSSITYMC